MNFKICCSAWNCKALKFLHKMKDSGLVDLWLGQPNASKNGKVKSCKKEFQAKIKSDDSATNETPFFCVFETAFLLQDDQGLKSLDRNWNFFDNFHAVWWIKSLTSEATPSATQLFKRAYKISHPSGLSTSWDTLPSFASSSQSAKIGLSVNFLCQKSSESYSLKNNRLGAHFLLRWFFYNFN